MKCFATATVLSLTALMTSAASAATVSAFFGYDQSDINNQDLTNPVDAFETGESSNNNIATNGTANAFTLTFTDSAGTGTATFAVTDNYDPADAIRQFANSLSSPQSSSDTLTVELVSIDNLDANSVTLDGVSVRGTTPSDYTATLPDGTTSNAPSTALGTNFIDDSSLFEVGDTLVISNKTSGDTSFNVTGFQITAAVPEPASLALVAAGSVLVLGRRRTA